MIFERLRFPKDYVRKPAEPPCALDQLIALDANLLPIEQTNRDTFPIGCMLRFIGWAVLPVLGGYRQPDAVLLRIGEKDVYLHATAAVTRDDVARDIGDDRITSAGFMGTRAIDDGISLGKHRLSLAVVGEDRSYVEVALARTIEIVESKHLFPKIPETERTTVGLPVLESMHARVGYDGNTRFLRGSILVARGESTERELQLPASRVFAIVDDERYFAGISGLPNARGERSGYSIRIPTRYMNSGAHTLQIAAISNDGTSFTLGERTRFVLRGA